jgi:hypothetical protein
MRPAKDASSPNTTSEILVFGFLISSAVSFNGDAILACYIFYTHTECCACKFLVCSQLLSTGRGLSYACACVHACACVRACVCARARARARLLLKLWGYPSALKI